MATSSLVSLIWSASGYDSLSVDRSATAEFQVRRTLYTSGLLFALAGLKMSLSTLGPAGALRHTVAGRVDDAARWLPKDLRPAVASMLIAGGWMAQDAVEPTSSAAICGWLTLVLRKDSS